MCLGQEQSTNGFRKTPFELVFGRRPLPLTDVETLDPAALSEDPLTDDLTNMQIQRLAIRAHMEAKQLQDLRRDIARNLRPIDGPYSPGDKIFFWEKDHSKIKVYRTMGQRKSVGSTRIHGDY